MTEPIKSYEADLKELILNKEHMFGELGDNVVLFEKAMSTKGNNVKKVIADVLIFSEAKGIVGVEIKSAQDSTRRLLRQLRSYSVTCDYVYVLVHDKHVPEVEKILKRYKFPYVGIISYIDFKGEPLAGTYKEAKESINKSVFHSLNMLWKTELLTLLSTLKNPHKVAMLETGKYDNVTMAQSQQLSLSSHTRKMKKSQIISEILSWLGHSEANKVLCQIFIQNRVDIERTIKLRHFNNPPEGDD